MIRVYRYIIIVVKSKNSMKNYCIVSHYLLLRRAPCSRNREREFVRVVHFLYENEYMYTKGYFYYVLSVKMCH